MDLKNFTETHVKLEEKAVKIMQVHCLEGYTLDSIEIEVFKPKSVIHINFSECSESCGTNSDYLTFELDEMINDIDYFEKQYKEKCEKIELENKKYREEYEKTKLAEKLAKQKKELKKEKAEYKRLRLKFENES